MSNMSKGLGKVGCQEGPHGASDVGSGASKDGPVQGCLWLLSRPLSFVSRLSQVLSRRASQRTLPGMLMAETPHWRESGAVGLCPVCLFESPRPLHLALLERKRPTICKTIARQKSGAARHNST